MPLIKHVVDADGNAQETPMTPEEEATHLAEQAVLVFPNMSAPPIQPISDRQFYQQLAIAGTITQAEALAAVQVGTIPPALMIFVESLPPEQQFDAQMILSGAIEFRRDHPYVTAIAAAQGMTNEQVDAFFLAASLL